MKNEDLDRIIDRAARDYNAPPPAPREEMWAEIRRRLDGPSTGAPGRADEGPDALDMGRWRRREARRRRLRELGPWGLGIAVAATLVVGFGLGRVASDRGLVPARAAPSTAAETSSIPVQLATAEHLGQAEAMLTLFRTAGPTADGAATAAWARDLLTTTRLLMDSRAGDDPAMAHLLGDLEVVLVQIVHVGAPGAAADEREMVEAGIQERQLITKLRAAAGGPLGHSI